ncbi:MAG: glycosyltransferase family 4 protein [Rhodospirillales bacterium]|nr:glycosyltransferase family 4 protein [Rhodospirillales bacterium]
MKVRIAVHGRFHAFELAQGLHRHGILECLQTTYPGFAVRRVIGNQVPLATAPLLELWRRFGPKLTNRAAVNVTVAKKFAATVASSLKDSNADILVGWSSATLEAIPVAHDKGMRVIIERGSTHISHQSEMLAAANESLGIIAAPTPGEIIERELMEYDACDAIMVPSEIAAASFVRYGIPREKIYVNRLGVDVSQFAPPRTPVSNPVPKILFVGEISARKGIAPLLGAFAKISSAAELVCVGPVDVDFQAALNKLPIKNVTFKGTMSRNDIHQAYQSADIFCLPSAEEGFGMVVLEAMASGLPVVISDQVGAGDLITDGKNGMIVPYNDETALSNALLRLVENAGLRSDLGAAALATTNSALGWDGYVDRAIAMYQNILN